MSKALKVLFLLLFVISASIVARAQSPVVASTAAATDSVDAPPSIPSKESSTSPPAEIERQLREQKEQIESMRSILVEQSRVIDQLRDRIEQAERAMTNGSVTTSALATTDKVPGATLTAGVSNSNGEPAPQSQEERLARLEAQAKQNSEKVLKIGSITFGGDIRLRYESLYGNLNALANGENPAILGNPLTTRQRFRVRARFSARGQIGKQFDWGLRVATGSFADSISSNQTFTDFINRKPIGLDQAYLTWTPKQVSGLRFQGGKFEIPWVRTELTLDNDLQVEGFNEIYSKGFKDSKLKNIKFIAWQLPLLERASGFVRNADGTVNLDQSARAGRDLAFYGAQVATRFEFSPTFALNVSAADMYFSGTQFISPIQTFGANLLIPVTITIPATPTSPAQTITTQVSIPRDLFVAGNGNLGVSTASNNAVNRDGRLSSGYNLIDIIARIDLTHSKRFPVTLGIDFVMNTQTRDVVLAGPGGADVFLQNNENMAYAAELLIGKSKERGDLQLGYTFARIEKDAVLTPFNFSDITQQSDVRLHRWVFNYAADQRILLSFIGIVTDRANGLLGVFGTTPPGSLDRPTLRLQFDTTFSF